MTTNENPAAVRVCAIADIECSRGCGTGECKREAESSQPAAAPIDEPTIPDELHPDTAKLVRRFARALANKLLAAQRKYGYSDNWMRDGWADECRAELMRHIHKGDPRDVAAYCAFLWHHNESTAPAPADERAAMVDAREIVLDWQAEHGIALTVGAINDLARRIIQPNKG
ncbi:hypothetical protein [Burkholderia dolosa]|uniref:hypothetical protein n=1 Tax=Burkholderia dolosa TaxID=152500 RepID=UPI001FC7CF44|nr:hypothetical protein [Burkholderia dolosa]